MDPKSQEIFNAILDKTPESLNKDEEAFLRARRGYLKPVDAERFKSILSPEPAPAPKEEPKEEEEAPLYVSKKDQKK